MFDRLSIRYKLVALLSASAALALLVSLGITSYVTYVTARAASLRDLGQLADVGAENLRAAMAFHDGDAAGRILAALQSNPHILLAVADDETGKPLAEFVSSQVDAGTAERLRTRARHLQAAPPDKAAPAAGVVSLDEMVVVRTLQLDGARIGTLAIVSDNQELRDTLLRHMGFQWLVSLLSLALIVALSLRLQHLFTRRILALREAMQHVSDTRHYDVSVPVQGHDEFSDLCHGFNTMVAEVRERDRRLSLLATTDELTGLANRRHAMEAMADMRLRANRKNEPLGLILLDVDHFKRVNDLLGHPVGDRVLQVVAQALRQGAREYDLVARFGGEEFLVLCDKADTDTVWRVAQRIRADVAAARVGHALAPSLQVTVSLGAYAVVPGDAPLEELLHIADDALYRAKNGGRNRVELGLPTPHCPAPPPETARAD